MRQSVDLLVLKDLIQRMTSMEPSDRAFFSSLALLWCQLFCVEYYLQYKRMSSCWHSPAAKH
jgi:hypothetical protein